MLASFSTAARIHSAYDLLNLEKESKSQVKANSPNDVPGETHKALLEKPRAGHKKLS